MANRSLATTTAAICAAAIVPTWMPEAASAQCDPAELFKLLADDGTAGDDFGFEVDISGDHAVISALWDDPNGTNSGAAYVFVRTESGWIQEAKLIPDDGGPDDHFGRSVSMDGDTIVIGAQNDDDNGSDAGAAYIFAYRGWLIISDAFPGFIDSRGCK